MFDYISSQQAPTHHELMKGYSNALQEHIASGKFRPIVLPYDGLGLVFVILFLCISHIDRPWIYAARWPIAAAVVAFYMQVIRETRSMFMGSGFGVGLIVAWSALWSVTWLVFNDPQHDARRVEKRERVKSKGSASVLSSDATATSAMPVKNNSTNSHQQVQNGSARGNEKGETHSPDLEYFWQSYPMSSLWTRLDWVLDLICNFRGPGWNWELSSNPELPNEVKLGLGENVDPKLSKPISSVGIQRFSTRSELARRILPRLIIGYLLLDVLKITLMKDTYFLLGPTHFPPPRHLSSVSTSFIDTYRQFLSLISIITALETIFALAPLTFALLLGPRILGLRGAPWQYPTTWGSFDPIFDKGLGGLWSGWWHQTFRFAFISPAQYLIKRGILAPKSPSTKIFGVFSAFALSGFLHGCGSYTQIAKTSPWHAPIFFMLQGLGIFIQTSFCQRFRAQINQLPNRLRRIGNFLFTFGWMYWTAPWLIDDFARGGIWLFQPVPFSPLRALGFGQEGDGWLCWDFSEVGWYKGEHWWQSGVSF